MMKSNALASLLTGAIIVCAIITGFFFLRYYLALKELQRLQGQYVFMNNSRNAAQSLANEAVEYSKRNPSIDPILYRYDIKQRPGTNSPAPAPSARGGAK